MWSLASMIALVSTIVSVLLTHFTKPQGPTLSETHVSPRTILHSIVLASKRACRDGDRFGSDRFRLIGDIAGMVLLHAAALGHHVRIHFHWVLPRHLHDHARGIDRDFPFTPIRILTYTGDDVRGSMAVISVQ